MRIHWSCWVVSQVSSGTSSGWVPWGLGQCTSATGDPGMVCTVCFCSLSACPKVANIILVSNLKDCWKNYRTSMDEYVYLLIQEM